MSEPTRKEMLEEIDKQRIAIIEMMQFSGRAGYHRDDLEKKGILLDAIRRLIETRPRVTRDFVQRWAERMSFDTGSVLGKVQPQIYQLEEMLKEAGVKIMEEIGIKIEEENKGKATKKFVEKWAKILDCDGLAEPDFYILIEDMLCEVGIEMEEEK